MPERCPAPCSTAWRGAGQWCRQNCTKTKNVCNCMSQKLCVKLASIKRLLDVHISDKNRQERRNDYDGKRGEAPIDAFCTYGYRMRSLVN